MTGRCILNPADPCPWQMDRFHAFKQISGYQAWCYKKPNGQCEDKKYITHLCDGAGTQGGDCKGQNAYFEEIGPPTSNTKDAFFHAGKEQYYKYYKCGWWRGFAKSQYAGASFEDTMDVIGMAYANGANYKEIVKAAATRDGWYQHPFSGEKADGYFIGALWDWVCAQDTTGGSFPFTGTGNKCYCNNEPRDGRYSGTAPRKSTYFLCSLRNDEMKCNDYTYVLDVTGKIMILEKPQAGYDNPSTFNLFMTSF